MPTSSPTRALPKVVVRTTVQGVDYELLVGQQEAYAAFETSIKETLADSAGPSVRQEQVGLLVTQGSVVVTAEISVPDAGAEADQLIVAERVRQLVQNANVSEKILESIQLAARSSAALQEAVQTEQLQATSQVTVVTAAPAAAPTHPPTLTDPALVTLVSSTTEVEAVMADPSASPVEPSEDGGAAGAGLRGTVAAFALILVAAGAPA